MSTKKKTKKAKVAAKPAAAACLPDLENIAQLMTGGDLQAAARAIDLAIPGAKSAEEKLKQFTVLVKGALDQGAPVERAFWEKRSGEWEITPDAALAAYDLLKGHLPKKRLVTCMKFSVTELVRQNAEHLQISEEQSLQSLRDMLHPLLIQKPDTRAFQTSPEKELSVQKSVEQTVTVPPPAVPLNVSLPQAKNVVAPDGQTPSLEK